MPQQTTRRPCLSFWMYSRVRATAHLRSSGYGPLTSMSKVGGRSKAVDPVEIDRGSSHKAFTTFAASNAASTNNPCGLGENIVEEGVATTEVRPGPTVGWLYTNSDSRMGDPSRLFFVDASVRMLPSHQSHYTAIIMGSEKGLLKFASAWTSPDCRPYLPAFYEDQHDQPSRVQGGKEYNA